MISDFDSGGFPLKWTICWQWQSGCFYRKVSARWCFPREFPALHNILEGMPSNVTKISLNEEGSSPHHHTHVVHVPRVYKQKQALLSMYQLLHCARVVTPMVYQIRCWIHKLGVTSSNPDHI